MTYRQDLQGQDKAEFIFGYHAGNDWTIPVHERVRVAFTDFMTFLDEQLNTAKADPRDMALVWTKMQEASMFTHAALAFTAPVVPLKRTPQ